MNDTSAATAASSANPPPLAAATPAATSPEPAPGGAGSAPHSAARPRGANASVPVAILAFLLASVALVLGVILLHRTDDITARLDQAHADDLLRDQHNTGREQRLAALEREWQQAQGDGDVSAGAATVTPADIRRIREQLALIDVERVLEQVQLQLRLGAAPQEAIDAVTAVDARLSRLASPGAQRVQTALRHDLARLHAAPDIDRGALVARLDPLLTAVDGWHASADTAHMSAPSGQSAGSSPAAAAPAAGTGPAAAAPAAARAAAPTGQAPTGAAAAVTTAGARLRAWLAREFGEYLRIREVDTPDALLLAPAQRQLLRDRFRLGVLDLRQAILARDERAVRAEAGALDALLEHYFDPNEPEVAAARLQIRAAAASVTPAAAITLDETLAALRAVRSAAASGAATP